MQNLKCFFSNGLIVLVIRDQSPAEIRGQYLGWLEVLAREGRLAGARCADQNDERQLRDRKICHRVNIPIWVGGPTIGSSGPIGRKRTVYPKRSAMRFAHA